MEMRMNTSIRSLLVSIAVVGLLSSCATYDYGYGYSQPYYGYGYDYGPSYYDYGPYYGYYGPGYYAGPPTIGFDFRSRGRARHPRADRRHDGDRTATRSHTRRPVATQTAPSGGRNRAAVANRTRVPSAPSARQAQSRGGRARPESREADRGPARPGSQQARAEQQ
jgi:hypothetical protein